MIRSHLSLGGVARADRCRRPGAPSPPRARANSCRSRKLPPAEQLPAAPLVVAAYAFVWLAMMFYLWTIWRRLSKVEDDMRALQRSSPEIKRQ